MSYTVRYLDFITEAAKKKAPAPAPAATTAPIIPPRPSFVKPIPKKTSGDALAEKMRNVIKIAANGDIKYTEDGLVECTYSSLERSLDILDRMPTKRKMGYSAIIYGEAGIGKSAVVEARARKMAAGLGRQFITLDEYINQFLTIQEVKSNFKDYYIFMDQRVAGMDPSMMTGIPDPTSLEKRGYLTEMPLPWVALMTMSNDAAGFLFLDELNMAEEEVQKALYSLLNFEERRIAGQYLIKGNWRIHSAGNWGEGYNSNPLRLALKERLAPYLLKIDFEGWAKWAKKSKNIEGQPIIHPILMDFIEENPTENFYSRPAPDEDATKRPNPRNFVALSAALYVILGNDDSLDNINSDTWEEILTQTGSICGKKFSEDFKQFLISNAIVQIEDIFDDPTSLLASSTGVESQITQRVAVFKRQYKKHVATFDDKFAAASEDGKHLLVQQALNYVGTLITVLANQPGLAADMFTPVVLPAMRNDFFIYRSKIEQYLLGLGTPEAEDVRQWANGFFNTINKEVGANSAALMGSAGPTSFISSKEENEESEELTVPIDPSKAKAINKILTDFERNLKTGNLVQYI